MGRRALILAAAALAACSTEPATVLTASPDSVVFTGFAVQPTPQSLTLASAGGPAHWTATPTASWLTLSLASGNSLPATFTVTANVSGKPGGPLTAGINVTAEGNAPITVPVRADIESMSGTWTGGLPGAVFTLNVSEAANGILSGAGTMVTSGGTLNVTVGGTHGHPNVSISLSATGFQPATVAGTFVALGNVSATVTGSGFTGEQLSLVKQ